jgi:hypothetical protein
MDLTLLFIYRELENAYGVKVEYVKEKKVCIYVVTYINIICKYYECTINMLMKQTFF